MTKPREIAFEGIDGAGKTTVIELVKDQLEQEGLTVVSAAPFVRATELLGRDTYPMWKDHMQSHLALKSVKLAVHEARSVATEAEADVLLWDRHWMTLWSDIEHDACLKTEWKTDFPPVAFLRLDAATARRRIGETHEPWATDVELGRYAGIYDRLAFQFPARVHGIYRSDDDVSPEAIARSVVWDMGARR